MVYTCYYLSFSWIRSSKRSECRQGSVTVHTSNTFTFDHFKPRKTFLSPGSTPRVLHEPVIGAARRDCFAIPVIFDGASCVTCDVSDDQAGVIHHTTRTLRVGDGARFVIPKSIARRIDSYREWCCRKSHHKILNASFPKPASDFSFWKEKERLFWISNSIACLAGSTCVRIGRIRHCTPVSLELPEIVLKTTAASIVFVPPRESFCVCCVFHSTIYCFLLWNVHSGACHSFLDGKSAL